MKSEILAQCGACQHYAVTKTGLGDPISGSIVASCALCGVSRRWERGEWPGLVDAAKGLALCTEYTSGTVNKRPYKQRTPRIVDTFRELAINAAPDIERRQIAGGSGEPEWVDDWWHQIDIDEAARGTALRNLDQPSPAGTGVEIAPLYLYRVLEKARRGNAKYGTTLRASNGRRPLWDAVDEAIDKGQYLMQAAIEFDLLVEQLAVAKAALTDIADLCDWEFDVSPSRAAEALGLIKEIEARQ